MDKFKRTVRTRIIWLLAMLAAAATVAIVLLTLPEERLGSNAQGIGVVAGIMSGASLCLIVLAGRHLFALRNDAALRKLYIKENDERSTLIRQKASSLGIQICVFGLLLATAVSCFFDLTVFFTLMGVVYFIGLVMLAMKLVYRIRLGGKQHEA